MKKISIHQPHFLPWLGYFNKIIHADMFVVLEQVQYRKNYFQNRCKIKGNNKDLWLSLPVKKSSSSLIRDVELINNKKDRLKIIKTLMQYYSKTKYFDNYFQEIKEILLNDELKLSRLNNQLLKKFLDILKIDTEIKFCKDFTENQDPNLRLIEICKNSNSDTYISGVGGKNYLDISLFEKNNIKVQFQNFNSNIEYSQVGDSFLPGLSILDVLFNVGAEQTKDIIYNSWIPKN
ncbi:WbqC family protein [Flavobacteriaceae bacterium]|nr:WbqC family protein [Flavobacteriaceae bacterium]